MARVRRRPGNARQMIRRGGDVLNAKRTKDLEALGRFITKKSEEGLPWQRGNKDGLDDQCATVQQRPPDSTVEIPQYGNDRPLSEPWHDGGV